MEIDAASVRPLMKHLEAGPRDHPAAVRSYRPDDASRRHGSCDRRERASG